MKASSVLKLVVLASTFVFFPLCLFFGVLALGGATTVKISGSPVTGIPGLLAAIAMAPLFVGLISCLAWPAAYLGILCWTIFKPLSLEYVSDE